MLLQALKEYAEEKNLAEDPSFEPARVHVLVRIGADGRFLGLVKTEGRPAKRGKKEYAQPKEFAVPKVGTRSSATESRPSLAVDGFAYVVGPGNDPKERRHHKAFRLLIERAARQTGDEALEACARFYGREDSVEALRKAAADLKGNERLGFALDSDAGRAVFEREAVKTFWRKNGPFVLREGAEALEVATTETGGEARPCLVCGEDRPPALTHEKIKGVPGANPTGASLASFDKDAFRSHGWEQNENSPVCAACAVKYVRALNHLLGENAPPTRVKVAGTAFVFWTRGDAPAANWFERPDPEEVRRLIEAVHTGRAPTPDDGAPFYCLALAGNGGRVVVRSWIESTVGEIRRNIGRWFADLEIVLDHDEKDGGVVVRRAGEPARPPGLYALACATARKADEVAPGTAPALVAAALRGLPIPPSILAGCLGRCRLGEFTAPRVGLIRAYLNRKERDPKMTTSLDETSDDPAYACGRLLAILERLQGFASGFSLDVGIVERYYAAASSTPRAVFPRLLRLARNHLAKVKADRGGLATNLEKDIEGAIAKIADFPATLELAAQGRFAIGFYHQRAKYRADSAARKEERSAA